MSLESNQNDFVKRHIGPRKTDQKDMLNAIGLSNVEELINKTVPQSIRSQKSYLNNPGMSESHFLQKAYNTANKNQIFRSYIGLGYYNTYTPSVILRNILENPGWYTAYTPYQAEISQGRMEALLNFQTMVTDLTKMEIANASLLDEGTAAAEAMAMAFSLKGKMKSGFAARKFYVDENCLPQTIDVIKTRANPLDIEVIVLNMTDFNPTENILGAIIQYPNKNGEIYSIEDCKNITEKIHQHNGLAIVAADILSLCLLTPPGEWGTDIALGNTQRFGVPMGFGGPHAAYFATKDNIKRSVPGRFIGVSKDSQGNQALRLALQTREQHIRREKATSNICTSQVLLAVIASMYAVYHGPNGLKEIAKQINQLTTTLKESLETLGHNVLTNNFFDTLTVKLNGLNQATIKSLCNNKKINFHWINEDTVSISLDETTTTTDLTDICKTLSTDNSSIEISLTEEKSSLPKSSLRKDEFLTHPIFNSHHSETEMMRYLSHLQRKDISLIHSMIPLGSCTMKLNAASEMLPITYPGFSNLHPFAPKEQTLGYLELFKELETWLADLTGFDAVSLQPNAGSQGEYAGLLAIKSFHEKNGDKHRNICLIPSSAHGTNPASAVMAGMKVVIIKCDDNGNIDINDLQEKSTEHKENLSALMVTYPSTHGVFEEGINEILQIVHDNGGQVYMDGANMNALLGICRPGEFGADVVHLNLHKTFCIPHGGGGPGMGPIAVKSHLAPFLPGHSVVTQENTNESAISSAPWGSPSILPISWGYIAMMGNQGLKTATEVAILSANYIAKKLNPHYPVLYKGKNGFVAHECIIDLRDFKTAGINVDDIAKRLMDYGFHAPTMSWPVAGTLMIEPTESESLAELDRFCNAMIEIRKEIQEVIEEKTTVEDSPLRNAPHTAKMVTSDSWDFSYSRQTAAFPLPYIERSKVWPSVGRVDNAFGDKNFNCSCPPLEDYV